MTIRNRHDLIPEVQNIGRRHIHSAVFSSRKRYQVLMEFVRYFSFRHADTVLQKTETDEDMAAVIEMFWSFYESHFYGQSLTSDDYQREHAKKFLPDWFFESFFSHFKQIYLCANSTNNQLDFLESVEISCLRPTRRQMYKYEKTSTKHRRLMVLYALYIVIINRFKYYCFSDENGHIPMVVDNKAGRDFRYRLLELSVKYIDAYSVEISEACINGIPSLQVGIGYSQKFWVHAPLDEFSVKILMDAFRARKDYAHARCLRDIMEQNGLYFPSAIDMAICHPENEYASLYAKVWVEKVLWNIIGEIDLSLIPKVNKHGSQLLRIFNQKAYITGFTLENVLPLEEVQKALQYETPTENQDEIFTQEDDLEANIIDDDIKMAIEFL